jgi:hypothetical protein
MSAVDPAPSSHAQVISSLEIESSDVVRIVLQFLKENNLTESMQMLQKESGSVSVELYLGFHFIIKCLNLILI